MWASPLSVVDQRLPIVQRGRAQLNRRCQSRCGRGKDTARGSPSLKAVDRDTERGVVIVAAVNNVPFTFPVARSFQQASRCSERDERRAHELGQRNETICSLERKYLQKRAGRRAADAGQRILTHFRYDVNFNLLTRTPMKLRMYARASSHAQVHVHKSTKIM